MFCQQFISVTTETVSLVITQVKPAHREIKLNVDINCEYGPNTNQFEKKGLNIQDL